MRPTRSAAAMLAALLLLLLVPRALLAQDVTLTSRDGSFALDGTMLGFDGEFYRIDTVYGPLTVDAMGVTCTGSGCPDLEAYVAEVTISGAETMGAVLMPALLEAFAAGRGLKAAREIRDALGFTYTISDQEGRALARIDFRLTTTDEGFADLVAGEADLAMAAREVRPAELALAREAGIGALSAPAQSRIVAFDAYVAAVAPANHLPAISPEDLGRALAGVIADWGGLGGPEGEPLRLHAMEAAQGAQQGIEAALLAPSGQSLSPTAIRHGDAAELADAVAGDPFALGVTLASALGTARGLPLAGGCGFTVAPEDAAIRSEDYPLVAPLFLYAPARRLPAIARDFLAFLSTPTAERVIRRAGFTDLGARRVPLAAQGERLGKAILAAGDEVPLSALQEMVRALEGAERLSPTFRFRPGAAGLDAPSRGNAIHLSEALEAGVYDGRELIFAGFSDGEGGAAANLRISRTRAETVMNAVRALSETADFGRVRLSALAFGEALPMACDDSAWGRRVNRRVEVWIR
ncbi:MAG: phosphate ABC transporter substrate-binding/OmpA family protein [Paracoccaceae bacterium]|nr:phosphate ABC transporter substrate-binding/OmpA family protein [Paracoccaceae bacterium]